MFTHCPLTGSRRNADLLAKGGPPSAIKNQLWAEEGPMGFISPWPQHPCHHTTARLGLLISLPSTLPSLILHHRLHNHPAPNPPAPSPTASSKFCPLFPLFHQKLSYRSSLPPVWTTAISTSPAFPMAAVVFYCSPQATVTLHSSCHCMDCLILSLSIFMKTTLPTYFSVSYLLFLRPLPVN